MITNLYWQRADNTGDVQRLTDSKNAQQAGSWHPTGKVLAFDEFNAKTGYDILILPMDGDETTGWKPGRPYAFLASSASELEAMFSPDGRWLAYVSNESGRDEVYVRPFPGPGGPWQISTGGGTQPSWSREHSELFYVTPDQRIMVAPFAVQGGSLRPGNAVAWSPVTFPPRPRQRALALHPDVSGSRWPSSPATPVKPPAGRTNSCLCSTSSTSCAGSRQSSTDRMLSAEAKLGLAFSHQIWGETAWPFMKDCPITGSRYTCSVIASGSLGRGLRVVLHRRVERAA